MKKKKSNKGRRKVGTPFSITLTDEQLEFINSLIRPGESRSAVIRELVQAAMVGYKGALLSK